MGFLATYKGFCLRGVFAQGEFLAVLDFWLYLTTLHNYLAFADMLGQSVANMQLMALYRLKFRLSYLVSIDIPTAKKVAKNVLFC
jgi:hypothetical protein